MVSEVSHDLSRPTSTLDSPTCRCTAPSDDLDADALQYHHGLRSHDHTDKLSEAFSLRELWDDFGIVGDLIVSHVMF